ncbi:MAG TPA: hypothetical protein PKX79_11650 [Spirochaetota bacterium]|nr:hypothetical protein [Spirochaetota bacterium]HON17221.1 hypothetical protein [Spirochaetota bacterium]HPP96021.1 hypothetical protein [Spirochaetota bacterium]HRS64180.1 hypothetical protein [Spirochaetota bacterium]HRU66657.1 hypothetical protein [Spirochaetota bacterium]
MNNGKIQLSMLLDSSSREAVFEEVRKNWLFHYEESLFSQVENAFGLICMLFDGNFSGYRKCNTEYHNLTHTFDALLAVSRLMDGLFFVREKFSPELSLNLHLAALLHDTGYIQEDWDREGTGAKYTSVHVERSNDFLRKNYKAFHLKESDIEVISQLILCTGIKGDAIKNLSEDMAMAGAILATGDLLGQMSDRAYLEKLLFLYYEFKEAGIEGFNTTFDILRKTLSFYEITKEKLDSDFFSVYDDLVYHFKERYNISENLYMVAIDNQIKYLVDIIEDESTNFRNKLKRLDLEKIELDYTISREYV